MVYLYVEFKSPTMQGFPDFPSDSSGATLAWLIIQNKSKFPTLGHIEEDQVRQKNLSTYEIMGWIFERARILFPSLHFQNLYAKLEFLFCSNQKNNKEINADISRHVGFLLIILLLPALPNSECAHVVILWTDIWILHRLPLVML